MIIQHNIMALNAHRQLSNNNSIVSKNLEKLSSGYRINRAGDDAAGLAISEKMRSQIKGLERAQLNAQDGISLVQTAEGALTEVHSMLTRLVELGTESANGTIQASDREKIQLEVDALTAEIDRISQSTNFNGIDLLNGSLGGGMGKANVTAAKVAGTDIGAITTNAPTAGSTAPIAVVATTAAVTGNEIKFEWADADGKVTTTTVAIADVTGVTTAAAYGKSMADALNGNADFKANFEAKADATTGALTISAKKTGVKQPVMKSIETTRNAAGTAGSNFTKVTAFTKGTEKSMEVAGANDIAAADFFTVNGRVFEAVAAGGSATIKGAIAFEVGGTDADTVTNLNKAMEGIGIMVTAAGNTYTFAGDPDAKTTGMSLQIGDTNKEYNQVSVSVADMSSAGLGIDGLTITDQGLSQAAIDLVNAAVETVSSARGQLGALQNRLEHTINNIGVTAENMSAAESRIRDVDMAKEMMSFTKNNVISQAAQAMLAQANQQPQQVLQLLR